MARSAGVVTEPEGTSFSDSVLVSPGLEPLLVELMYVSGSLSLSSLTEFELLLLICRNSLAAKAKTGI